MNYEIEKLMVNVDGEWFDHSTSEIDIKLEFQEKEGYNWAQAKFINKNKRTIRFGGFKFSIKGFTEIPGEQIRVYRDGWTMASAAASVRYGDCDFEVDPTYLNYALCSPEDYDPVTPNKFYGEHVVVLNDEKTDQSLLAGFITSADQFSKFEVTLDKQGVTKFDAFSLGDGIEVEPNESIQSEELVLMSGNDGYSLLETFGDLWGERMNALSWDHVPTGWCSWYYYFSNITEKDVIENVSYLSKNKSEFPMEYIQLDDGYQSALGDWLICNDKFPNGLEYIAKEVSSAGLKPGLWLAPFMVEERALLFKEHQDWMVKDANGEIIWVTNWRGSRVAVLDGTHPGAQQYLTTVFSTLVEWGFEYVKLDFMVYACAGQGGCYYDKKATRAQALRRGLEVIRKAMGDKFILGCTVPLGPVVGLVNGERTGTDIAPYWQPDRKIYKEAPTVPNVCRNIINRSYMNGRLWISDPDTHIARTDNNELTENEVILWTYALYFTGGMMLLSDRFETLTPERAELSKLLLSDPGIFETRPLDIFDREYPAVWLRRRREKGEILLGLFNFEDNDQNLEADLNKIEVDQSFTVTDLLTQEQLGRYNDKLSLDVPAHSCKILKLDLC